MPNLFNNWKETPKISFPEFQDHWIVNECQNLEIEALNYFDQYKAGSYSYEELKNHFRTLFREQFFTASTDDRLLRYLDSNNIMKNIAHNYNNPNINLNELVNDYIDALAKDPFYQAFKELFLDPLQKQLFVKENIDARKIREIKSQKIQISSDTSYNKIIGFVDFLDQVFREEYLRALRQTTF